jgi:hypothetical protein
VLAGIEEAQIINYLKASGLNPNVAYLYRGKTRKSASDVATHRLGQVEAYLTVREVLSEASTAADDVLSREPIGFFTGVGMQH